MKFNLNGGGRLNNRIRFYVLAIVVGLIFSAVVSVASTTIGTDIFTDGTLTVTDLSASMLIATDANKILISTSTISVNNLALPKGNFIVGNDAGVAQATSTILISSTGDITPVKRLILPMGEISYFDTTGTLVSIDTQSNGSTNLVKVAPTTSLSSDIFEFDNGGANNGRLRYTGVTTKMFHTAFTISMDGEGTGTNLYIFSITKNGAVVSGCKVIQSIAVSNDTQSTALHCMVSLSTNDYIELYVGNLTDNNDITVKTINLFAMGL